MLCTNAIDPIMKAITRDTETILLLRLFNSAISVHQIAFLERVQKNQIKWHVTP